MHNKIKTCPDVVRNSVRVPRSRREISWHTEWDEADNINLAEVLAIIGFAFLLVWAVFG